MKFVRGTKDAARNLAKLFKNWNAYLEMNPTLKKYIKVVSNDGETHPADCVFYDVTEDPAVDTWMLRAIAEICSVAVENPSEYLLGVMEKNNIPYTRVNSQEALKALGLSFTYVDGKSKTTMDLIADFHMDDKEYKDNFNEACKLCDQVPGSYIKSGDYVIYKGKLAEIMNLPLEAFAQMKIDSDLFKKLNS